MKKSTIKNSSLNGTTNQGTKGFLQTIKGVTVMLLLLALFCINNNINAQYAQQGDKLVPIQNTMDAISLSGDGNTAVVGGMDEYADQRDVDIFLRTNGIWSQLNTLQPDGAYSPFGYGTSVAISGDGNYAIVGGADYDVLQGGVWFYENVGNNNWVPQQISLNYDPWEPFVIECNGIIGGVGAHHLFGFSVALSNDGGTAIIGAPDDNLYHQPETSGAVWIFSGHFSYYQKIQYPEPGISGFGARVSMSADGNTALVSGGGNVYILSNIAGTWYITKTLNNISSPFSISPDGRNIIVGNPSDNGGIGDSYVYFNDPIWGWVLQGPFSDPNEFTAAGQGSSVALSYSGDTAFVGGTTDGIQDINGNYPGAAWIYIRTAGVWGPPLIKLTGTTSVNEDQGGSCLISYDGNTAMELGGGAWVFISCAIERGAVAPTLFDVTADPVCAGSSVTITEVNGNLNQSANWQWYSGGCGTENGGVWVGSGASITVSPTITTDYFVRGEGSTDAGCPHPPSSCYDNSILVSPSPAPAITVSDVVCGVSATLDAGAGILDGPWSYQWNTLLNNTNEQYDVTTGDPSNFNYDVTVTNAYGCTGVAAPLQVSYLSSFFPETFEEASFPPPCWSESNNFGNPWSQSIGANGPSNPGNQSAMMDFWNIGVGGTEQLNSSQFAPTPVGYVLQFDESYASAFNNDDQLQISSSPDGINWNQVVLLDGGDSGPLNTGGDDVNGAFIPANNQWQTLIFPLPTGTTNVQFSGISANGNNLFIDNVNIIQGCIGTPTAGTISPALTCNTSGNLTLAGQSTDPGITIQWQTSPDGINFTDIAGATSSSYTTPVVTSATYFQCVVTCAGSGQFTLSNIVTLDPPPTPTIYSLYSTTFCEGYYDFLYAVDQNFIEYPTYEWSNGDNTYYSFAYGPTGNYSVTVTDNSGCTAITSIPLTVNPNPIAVITANGPTTLCQGGSVTLDAGGPFVSYLWDDLNNSITETITEIASGTYDVTVTDGNGCTGANTQIVTINSNPTVSAGDVTGCAGTNITLSGSPAGGTWTVANPYTNVAGNYSYSYNYTDGNGCSGNATSNITVNANPIVTAGDVSGCQGSNITLLGSPIGGTWTVANPYSNVTSGTYPYTYNYTDGNGCSGNATSNITVNANPLPVISADGPTVFDQGGNVVLDAGVYSTYLWSTTAITQIHSTTETIDATETGTYFVTVTDVNGCTNISAIGIVVNPVITLNPFITANGPTTFCSGNSVTLTVDAYTSYNWSNGDITQSITVSTSGTYSVTVTDNLGNTGVASQIVTVNSNPVVTAGDVTGCALTNIFLSGSPNGGTWTVDNPYFNAAGNYTYTYTYTDGHGCAGNATSNITINANPIVTAGNVSGCAQTSIALLGSPAGGTWTEPNPYSNVAGNYAYTYNYTDNNGCSGNATSIITVNANPTVTAGNVNGCSEANITLLGSPAGGTWSVPNPYSNATGNYSYTYNYADGNGCSGNATSNITVNANPTVSAGDVSGCAGTNITLLGSPNGGTWTVANPYNNVAGNYSYTYNYTDGNGCSGNATSNITVNSNPNVTAGDVSGCAGTNITLNGSPVGGTWTVANPYTNIAGTYPYTYNYTDGNGCQGNATSNITVNANPTVTAGDVSGCSGTNITLSGSPNGGTWTVANPYTNIAGNYSYIYNYTDGNGCSGNAISNITVNANPTVTAGDVSGCAGTNITLNGSPVGGTWTVANPYNNVAGNYSYTYNYTDGNGCSGNATSNITVNANPTVTAGDVSGCTGTNITLLGSPNGGTWTVANPYTNIAGNYPYTYNYTDGNGCSGNATSNITVNTNPTPTITPNGPTTFNQGGNVMLDAGVYSSWIWSTNEVTETIDVTTSGTYFVTVNNGNGCSGITSIVVTVNNNITLNPTITANGPSTFCSGNSVILDAGAYTSYHWNTGAISESISVSASGTYSVTVTDNSGNTGVASQIVTVNSNPIVTAGDVNGCAGTNITLLGSPAGGTWSVANPYTNVAGNYSYTYNYTNGNGCQGNATSNITINANPNVSTGGVSGCAGSSITLLGSPAGGTWSVPNPYSNALAGTYLYTYNYTDGNGCANSSTSNIVINANPTVTAGNVNGCIGLNITLMGSPAGGTWSVANPYFNLITGTYPYTYNYTNGNGCSGNATSTITVNPNPTPPVITGPISFCSGHSVTIGLSSIYTSYIWSNNATTPTITVNDGAPYSVTVSNGHCTAVTSRTETVLPSPAPTITATLNNYCEGLTSAILGVATYQSYHWSVNSATEFITVPPSSPGTYSITVTSANGCTGTSSYTLSATCTLPTQLATTSITATTAYASWTQPACVYGYIIRISKHNANSWTNYTITPNTHYTFSALSRNTSYDWQIQSNCNASGSINSGFSPSKTFATLPRLADGESDNNSYAFNVYPNPANDHAIIAFTAGSEDNFSIRLIDVTGRIIQSENYTSVIGENQYQMNLSQVAKGVYTVILQNKDAVLQSKIVVQ